MSFLPPTQSRLTVKRNGASITRLVPKPRVLIDTREQRPFTFEGFGNWIGGTERATLPVADYTVAGMEGILAMERKSLPDLVGSIIQNRQRFLTMCEKLAEYPHRCIIVEASYEQVKSPYCFAGMPIEAHPNGVTGTLDAINAKWGIEILYTSHHRALAEERAASWLSKHFTYWWLEQNGHGRCLQSGDL